jgi:hypothetical protein
VSAPDWVDSIDRNSFRSVLESSDKPGFVALILQDRHAAPLIDQVSIPLDGRPANWHDVLKVYTCLQELAALAAQQAGTGNADREAGGGPQALRVITRDKLARFVADVSDMELSTVRQLLDLFVLAIGPSVFDEFATALWPVSTDHVVLIPSLILGSHPLHLLEHCVHKSGRNFTTKGKPFESDMASLFRSLGIRNVKESVVISENGRDLGEADVVVLWDSHLFVFETKCLAAVRHSENTYRHYNELNVGAGQARDFGVLIHNHWDQFRQKVAFDSLPSSQDDLTIVPVVLTNVLEFSGLDIDGVAVTDDLLISAYFGPQHAHLSKMAGAIVQQSEPLVKMREVRIPKPDDFAAYLRSPPLIRFFLEHLSMQVEVLRPLVDGQRSFAYFIPVFSTLPSAGLDDGSGLAAEVGNTRRIGMNEDCPCGSGRKYKKCCRNKT